MSRGLAGSFARGFVLGSSLLVAACVSPPTRSGGAPCNPGEVRCDEAVLRICPEDGAGFVDIPCAEPTPECSVAQRGCAGVGGVMVMVPAPGGGFHGIHATEVTRDRYAAFLDAKGGAVDPDPPDVCSWNTSYTPTCDWPPTLDRNHPVACVDYCDAAAFCRWAGGRLCGRVGSAEPLDTDDDYDPLQSQWTNACSSGGRTQYPYGNTRSSDACNLGEDHPSGCSGADCGPLPVGSLLECQASGAYSGVFDLLGNVLEWEDACGEGIDGGGALCALRGGGAGAGFEDVTCTTASDALFLAAIIDASPDIGFRCCTNP